MLSKLGDETAKHAECAMTDKDTLGYFFSPPRDFPTSFTMFHVVIFLSWYLGEAVTFSRL